MANFSKSFNFRGGFQVDTDNFVVRGDNVGIGSSVPSERLDVDGIVKSRGLIVDSSENVFISTVSVGVLSAVTARAGIYTGTDINGGIATYYGDGSQLINLPSSQWLDIDVGLGFTSIYAQGNVGVATDDPRYSFQVGGVPFGNPGGGPVLSPQPGVGIEDGDIFASGIITTRGQFIGVGSLITRVDADNITSGTLSTERFPSVIYVDEIVAAKLTGISSSSLDLVNAAEIDIVSVAATRIEATGKFISTEGYIQVGEDVDVSNHGDIEVFRTDDDTTIFSISEEETSYILVGQERPLGSTRQYGGLRKGVTATNPIVVEEDLDIVNYDVGNVNFFLHSGFGGQGATQGSFRWLYGQNDDILATLTPDGEFTLSGNVDPSEKTLIVNGGVTIGDNTDITGDISVTGLSTVTGDSFIGGDLTVVGEITLSGIVNGGATFSEDVQVGGDPSANGVGVLLGIGGTVYTNTLEIRNAGLDLIRTNLSGDIFVSGIGSFNSIEVANQVNANQLIIGDSISGPNFSINSTQATFQSIVSNGNIDGSAGSVSASNVVTTKVETNSFSATGVGTFQSLDVVGQLTAGEAEIGQFNSGITVFGSANVTSLTADSGTFNNSLTVTDSITTPSIGAGVGSMSVTSAASFLSGLFASNIDSNSNGIKLGQYTYEFVVDLDPGNEKLIITILDGITNIGTVELDINLNI